MAAKAQRNRRDLSAVAIPVLSVVLAASVLLALAVGSVNVPLADVFTALWNAILGRTATGGDLANQALIVVGIRLPRVITAAIVGASLAVSGTAMQGLLRNPLADGSILGISSGGSLGAVLFLALGSALPPAVSGLGAPLFSIAFAFLSLFVVLALAYRMDRGFVTNTILLLGVVFSMLAGSLTSLVIAFSGNKLEHLMFWMLGSLSGSGFDNLVWLLPVSLACIVFLSMRGRELNAFALGEEQAAYLGVNTKAVKLQVMVAVSALIGASVAVSGIIGFVGLVPPHIVRLFTGADHRKLVPASALFGASFLVLADLLSRTVVRPQEVPIGVVTSLVGSVLFLYLFNSMRGRTQ